MIIRHFLADGTEVKDMTGYVVPINSSTIVAYQLLYKKALEEEEKKCSSTG